MVFKLFDANSCLLFQLIPIMHGCELVVACLLFSESIIVAEICKYCQCRTAKLH